jgi:hypothetical protein
MTTHFFSPLSFVAVFGSGIQDPGSGMGKNQDPGSGINIPDPQHWHRCRTHAAVAHIPGASKIKLKNLNKKRMATAWRLFFGIYQGIHC